MLTDLYLLPLLSGQSVDLVVGELSRAAVESFRRRFVDLISTSPHQIYYAESE